MKHIQWLFALIILLICSGMPAEAQYQLIVQKHTIVSRSLSGYVDIGPKRVAGKNVTVELRNSGWKTVLTSTKTDDKGYFSLETPPGKLFYLRFSSPGVNPLQVKVRISKHATRNLNINMDVAT